MGPRRQLGLSISFVDDDAVIGEGKDSPLGIAAIALVGDDATAPSRSVAATARKAAHSNIHRNLQPVLAPSSHGNRVDGVNDRTPSQVLRPLRPGGPRQVRQVGRCKFLFGPSQEPARPNLCFRGQR